MEKSIIKKCTTNRGNPALIFDGFMFYKQRVKKAGDILWRCSSRACKVSLLTDGDADGVVCQKHEHNHEPSERKLERHQVRQEVKARATQSLGEATSSVVRKVLQASSDNLERSEIQNLNVAAWRSRCRKVAPVTPLRPRSKQEVPLKLFMIDIMYWFVSFDFIST